MIQMQGLNNYLSLHRTSGEKMVISNKEKQIKMLISSSPLPGKKLWQVKLQKYQIFIKH